MIYIGAFVTLCLVVWSYVTRHEVVLSVDYGICDVSWCEQTATFRHGHEEWYCDEHNRIIEGRC